MKANYSRTAATLNNGRVIPELANFVHLLPDMTRVDHKGQMELYHVLYEHSVRVSAVLPTVHRSSCEILVLQLYTCLQNYLSLCVFGTPLAIESLTQTEMSARLSAADIEVMFASVFSYVNDTYIV